MAWLRSFVSCTVVRTVLVLGCSITGAQHLAAQSQNFELRWGGMVSDTFGPDGLQAWSVEDGGRIRRRDAFGNWTFQTVPDEVHDTLRRVFFLPDKLTGWAVGQNGWVIKTLDGGLHWATLYQMPAVLPGGAPFEDLWDIHFLDAAQGWLCGLHAIWFTQNGGSSWTQATLIDRTGAIVPAEELELYALDVAPGTAMAVVVGWPAQPHGMLLGFASAEPGFVFKTVDGVVWQIVFDIHDLCPTNLPPCAQVLCDEPPPGEKAVNYEPWDIEISRHATQPLAIVVGGVETTCGLIFTSSDYGVTWGSEPHECKCAGQPGCIDCNSNPLYNDDPTVQTDTWRLKKLFTLYGVGIFDGDNSAVACGYSGQHLVRDPLNKIWRDRSSYSTDPVHAAQAVTLPMFGAEASAGTANTGRAWITGMGGYVRRTTNGGQTWTSELIGEPWRPRDVRFFDLNVGWMVGQFYRLAKTVDGGRTWKPAAPEPQLGTGFLNAIEFANPFVGIAVGDIDNRPGPHQGKPKILFTVDGGQTAWLEPSTYPYRAFNTATALRKVSWAGGLEFWAVGDGGLMLHTTDGGDSWNQFGPPGQSYPQFKDIEFEGVSFRDAGTGLFVGRRPSVNGTMRGVAFLYQSNQIDTVQWTDISPADTTISILADVDLGGGGAYAVGMREVGGAREGVIVKSIGATSGFSQFVEVPHPPIPACSVDENLGVVPVLNEVEIAADGDVWAAGECGRVWQFTSALGWVERKSQTDSHVYGMSFPAADTGFLACQRASRTGPAIVRYRP